MSESQINLSPEQTACYGKPVANHNGINLIACKVCQCVHQQPYPEVEKYYSDDSFYAEHAPADWLDKVYEEHRRGDWEAAYDYQTSLLPSPDGLLDVGCGAGWFMQHWYNSRSKMVFGIEPSRLARNAAPRPINENIYETFEMIPAILHNWHVRLSLVLEHVPYPSRFLAKYVPITSPSSSLMVIVPNDFSPLQERLDSKHFISPVHVNYFTPKSLNMVVKRAFRLCGFYSCRTQLYGTFPMEIFPLMGINYIGNDALGRKCHNLRLKIERVLGVTAFRAYSSLMRRYHWGREIIMVASHAN